MSSGIGGAAGDPRIVQLRQAALSAMAAGRFDEAERLWNSLLSHSPEHAEALQFKGQRAAQRGDFIAARGLFERAARSAPRDPVIQLGLAFTYRKLGDEQAEMAALTAALTADPYCYPALLAKGASLERNGLRRQAARIYRDALKIVPPEERLAPALREEVAHARAVMRDDMQAFDTFLGSKLAPLRAKHATADQGRANEAMGVMIGRNKHYASEASLLRFPQLPAVPFFDRSQFPWMHALESKTDAIREELLTLLEVRKEEFRPYIHYAADAPLNQWAELNNSPAWSALHLWADGERVEKNCAVCPLTIAALEDVPLTRVPGAEPTAIFSALQPHTHIPPHSGVTNARAVVHLPLILPGSCRFRVGNDTREWKIGEAWAFDDTIEHEAWNGSDQLRVVLIFNVWNPFLSEAERDFASALISGFYEYQSGA